MRIHSGDWLSFAFGHVQGKRNSSGDFNLQSSLNIRAPAWTSPFTLVPLIFSNNEPGLFFKRKHLEEGEEGGSQFLKGGISSVVSVGTQHTAGICRVLVKVRVGQKEGSPKASLRKLLRKNKFKREAHFSY